jgi:hypothetical protein
MHRGRIADETTLVIASGENDASTVEQFLAIRRRVAPSTIHRLAGEIELTFNIAVYYSTLSVTSLISSAAVAIVHEYGAAISISSYPVAAG